jgi:hypothetical protein
MKRKVVAPKKGKGSSSLTTDHITRPALPDLVQTQLVHVGMKVYRPHYDITDI